jgi:hypothetical protein
MDHLVGIHFENDHQELLSTDYWDCSLAREGRLFVSPNAGALRILVPDALAGMVEEIKGASHCVLSRGPWANARGADGFEFNWVDGSDAPFTAVLGPDSFLGVPEASGVVNNSWVW